MQCSECYRGIHSSCLGENNPRVSCSRCIAAVRRSLDFPPSVPTSPAPRFFLFFFVFGVNFFWGIVHTIFVPNICLHVCFPDHSKKDEIKSMGDVKSDLVKKVSKTHMKRKYLSELYKDHDPSDLPFKSDEELEVPYDSPLKS